MGAGFGARRVGRAARSLLSRVNRRFMHDPEWTIGVLAGPSPTQLRPLPGMSNPIIRASDLPGRRPLGFVADPFALEVDGRWHLLYEVLDLLTGRGRIAASSSADLRSWHHHGVVLSEPFHLSYPTTFLHEGEVYMVPEAWESGAVRLYRADPFPTRWVHVADLLHGPRLLDPTVFVVDGRWWMFLDSDLAGSAGTLELYGAPKLTGPWSRHPRSPLLRGRLDAARPAGRVVRWDDGSLVRLAQDCTVRYGDAVHALRIDRLDEHDYEESALVTRLLMGTGDGWSATSMHHADLHRREDGWLAFVDGHASA